MLRFYLFIISISIMCDMSIKSRVCDQCPKLGKFLTGHGQQVKLCTKIWSIVTGYNAFLRNASRSLAVLASFDLQTGSNFVHW